MTDKQQKTIESRNPRRPLRRQRRHARPSYRQCPVLSRDQLADFLRQNNLKSTYALAAMRKKAPATTPTLHDFHKAWGVHNWRQITDEVFGVMGRWLRPTTTDSYLLACVYLFNIFNRADWERKRKLYPQEIPSTYAVRRAYGSFSKLFDIARRQSSSRTWQTYLLYALKLGKKPSRGQIKQRYGRNFFGPMLNIHKTRKHAEEFCKRIYDTSLRISQPQS